MKPHFGWQWALWLAVQPPERGGLGIDPLTARKMTPQEAIFYLSSEATIKRQCAEQNERSNSIPSPESQRAALAEEMRRLRLKYTGSEELSDG
jgi:hypothetical protein